MSHITKARSAGLASVCRMVVASKRHGRTSVDVLELEAALDGVDVEGSQTLARAQFATSAARSVW